MTESRRAKRLDVLLVEHGLLASREQARRAVMAGLVSVDGRRVDKPGTAVAVGAALTLAAREPYVSRGGHKLAGALDAFAIDPAGMICLDVGASTGGFTDCLLQRGAVRVYAVDVGYGQLDQRLREDPRVVVMERINARHLPVDALGEAVDLAVIDVSFISLLKVLPAVVPHVRRGGHLLPLIKPQFEVGRGQLGKGGILRDDMVRRSVIEQRIGEIGLLGLEVCGLIDSPLAGADGNREALAWLRRPAEADQEQSPLVTDLP